MTIKIKDDEIIYIAVDEGFRFFKLEDGLSQFATKPQFTPDFIGMTSEFKISDKIFKLRSLIAFELDHANHWNNAAWNYYVCRLVDSKGVTVRAKFNNLFLDSSGFRTFHGGNAVTMLEFTLYDSSGYEDFTIKNNSGKHSLVKFIRKFVFAIQIANTIEEFKKGLLVYDLIYRFFGGKMPDRLYEEIYKHYQGEMGDLSKHIPRVSPNHKDKFFAVADNYEKHLDSIKEYERIHTQISVEINPYRWED